MQAHFRHIRLRNFQWYKGIHNPMGFDPCNHFLKIQESIGTPIFKVGAHLGIWRFILSHSPTLPGAWNVTSSLHTWPTPSQALTLVVSPRLGLWHLSCDFVNVCIFVDGCVSTSTMFSSLAFICIVYASTNCCSTFLSFSISSMNIKSINVALGIIYALARQCLLLFAKTKL
jgi:hypothetical protein